MKKLLLLLLFVLAAPANAVVCGEHDKLVAQISKDLDAPTILIGQVDGEIPSMIEMIANRETGKWVVVITGSAGRACIPAYGTNFKDVAPGIPS